MAPNNGAQGVWGDGFAGDGFAAARAVTDWDGCSTDEYAVLFPRLVPTDGRLPSAASAHLAACVAARGARLARIDPAPSAREGEPARAGADRIGGAGSERAWFAGEGFAASLVAGFMRAAGLARVSPERVAAERRLLALLEGLLGEVRRGLAPAWSADREAWFAFGSGIHPAYLWPEGAVSPDRGLTAAWLGHLDRGRAALMPEAVAGYLLDAVLNADGDADRTLAAMVGAPDDARRLRRAAAARLAGGDPAVRFGRGRHRAASRLSRIPRPAVPVRKDALEDALEHA